MRLGLFKTFYSTTLSNIDSLSGLKIAKYHLKFVFIIILLNTPVIIEIR